METIWLWWIGERRPLAGAVDHVRLHLQRAFGPPVRALDGPGRPRGTLDPRRGQHRSAAILAFLLEQAPAEGKVLGMTDVDLYIPILTFVFGEAQLGGRAAVVSTARLGEGAPGDGRVLVERLAKEAVHELGHAFGFAHCAHLRCALSRSPSLREVDEKGGDLCLDCQDRLAGVRPAKEPR